MGLGKIFTKMCAQLHVFSLWRLTWVFEGTWKNFHKNVCPVTRFFAVETILSFGKDLEKFSQKCVPSYTFFRCGDYFKFGWDLEKFRQKCVPSYTFSQCRLSQVFGWDLEKFRQKCVPSYTFFRCGDYLKFWKGLGKIFTKMCAQLHVFSLWRLF